MTLVRRYERVVARLGDLHEPGSRRAPQPHRGCRKSPATGSCGRRAGGRQRRSLRRLEAEGRRRRPTPPSRPRHHGSWWPAPGRPSARREPVASTLAQNWPAVPPGGDVRQGAAGGSRRRCRERPGCVGATWGSPPLSGHGRLVSHVALAVVRDHASPAGTPRRGAASCGRHWRRGCRALCPSVLPGALVTAAQLATAPVVGGSRTWRAPLRRAARWLVRRGQLTRGRVHQAGTRPRP